MASNDDKAKKSSDGMNQWIRSMAGYQAVPDDAKGDAEDDSAESKDKAAQGNKKADAP